MTQLPDPLSRRDRQRQTREALIFAARAVFSEDGYHAASLERIAREAGFSKGAVYSNFDGKSALFLAVMDQNLELAEADPRHPFEKPSNPASTGWDVAEREGYPLEATQGFALATLEFIASAARDETLAPQLHQRLAAVLDRYDAIARKARPDDETLGAAEVGTLLAALDQGAGLILLAGDVMPDPAVFTAGMRRLVDPARAAAEAGPEA
ncbi:TetR/AcrR family transcriptional regulator [Brachybacterium fresconis]|uniref:AcrR family transcriptional regulator n=1 Tax=Brachybacterium fresconis TaxID=173363 RepID=A0ABS4YI17_9MICO|nr:TetR/AcrR family transcriptional regulator [Brachybacterium fresconis]MBP2408445.1 AcrR family transcriptional regulator [Brachybacterium fresconis]